MGKKGIMYTGCVLQANNCCFKNIQIAATIDAAFPQQTNAKF